MSDYDRLRAELGAAVRELWQHTADHLGHEPSNDHAVGRLRGDYVLYREFAPDGYSPTAEEGERAVRRLEALDETMRAVEDWLASERLRAGQFGRAAFTARKALDGLLR